MARTWIFGLIFLSFPAFAELPSFYPPEPLQTGQVGFASEFEYYITNANFSDQGGTYLALDNSSYYQRYNINLLGHYDFSERLRASAGFGYANAQSDDGTFRRTDGTLTDLVGGLQYQIHKKTFLIVPELWMGYPFTRVTPTTDAVITSEGAIFAQLGVWLKKPFGRFSLHGYAGYKFQDEGRAGLMPYVLGATYQFPTFAVSAALTGEQTISKDSNSNNPSLRNGSALVVNAGSLRYEAVNPNILSARGYVDTFWTEAVTFRMGVEQSLNGRSTASGLAVNAMLLWNFPWVGDTPQTKLVLPKPQTPETFEVPEKDYDENLFNHSPTAPPNAEPATQGDEGINPPQTEEVVKPKPKPKKKKNKKSLKQLLNETQDSVDPESR